jgi:acyl-CoA synthetase (AMP-forming)/AMP-acid ligase II
MIKLHNFPRWWLPDMIEVVEEIPKTSLGNFKKKRAAREVRPEGSR